MPQIGTPGDERARAVDRVEHPSELGIAAFRAELLADNAVGGERLRDQPAHFGFSGPVRVGHRVEVAGLGFVFEGEARAEIGQDRITGLVREPVHERFETAGDGHQHAASYPTILLSSR